MPAITNQHVARLFDDAAEQYDDRSNPYAMRRRAQELASHVCGRSLELGGGTAAVTAELPERSRAILSDIAPNMCRQARRKVGCPSICFDAEVIPFADGTIDSAISCEMIYYLDHPERFAAEAFRVLRTGGRLLISTTNPVVTILERGRSLLRKMGFKRMFFDDGSPNFISMSRLVGMLERAGFVIESRRHIVVLPFAPLDRLNRILERTPLRHFALFMIVCARKV